MSFIQRMRRQKAVWWQRLALDRYGRYTYAEPVEVKCRWEDVSTEYLGANGEKLVSRAVVYVDRVMSLGDRLWKGVLDSTTPDNPMSLSNAYEVKQFEQLPDLKNRQVLLTARL